jgi:hypothetical protein
MVWELSERKSLDQIARHNQKIKAKYSLQRFQELLLKQKIRREEERHDKALGALQSKLYDKEHAGREIPREIEISSKHPELQELFDQVEAWASVIQYEPKFDVQHVYLINGKWFDLHASFGPFRDDKGEIIDKNNIDWVNPIINKKEYEVKRKNG